METVKKMWAWLTRRRVENDARKNARPTFPTQKHIREMIAAAEQSRAELAEAAVRNGLRTL